MKCLDLLITWGKKYTRQQKMLSIVLLSIFLMEKYINP